MHKYMFADESGDFEFSKRPNVSRYFIVCTITLDDCSIGERLLKMRREMAMAKAELGDYFHCCEDKQPVRDRVFELIQSCELTIDATIMEKSKAQPQVRESEHRFYQYGWFYHLKKVAPRVCAYDWWVAPPPEPEPRSMLITAASLGTKRQRALFNTALNDVSQQVARTIKIESSFVPSATDPCLWVADYCTWAIQRKWERGDTRSYDLIVDKIAREYDLFRNGAVHYY